MFFSNRKLRTWRETGKWMLSIAVMLEYITCLPLKKLIKFINLSFLLLKCIFSTSFLSFEAVSVYNIGRDCNPQTFVTFRYSCLLLRDFRARGEANIPWGLNSVSYATGCLGLQIMLSQCKHMILSDKSPLCSLIYLFCCVFLRYGAHLGRI